MKKKCSFTISILLLFSCKITESDAKTEAPMNSIYTISDKDDYSDSQNDLVYRDCINKIEIGRRIRYRVNRVNC
jgi:hypothetical protein